VNYPADLIGGDKDILDDRFFVSSSIVLLFSVYCQIFHKI